MSFCSGPPSPNSHAPVQIAIQLSMIVVITSLAPVFAFRIPAIDPHSAPAAHAANMHSRMCGSAGIDANEEPAHTAM